MKIKAEVDVCDHEKYCYDYTIDDEGKMVTDECSWIADRNYCELFGVEGLEVEQKPTRTIKCPECKRACLINSHSKSK